VLESKKNSTNIRYKFFLLVTENLRESKGYNDVYGGKLPCLNMTSLAFMV